MMWYDHAMACEWPQQLSFQILRIRTPQHFPLRQSKMFNPFQARCFFSLTIFFFVFGPVYLFFFPFSTVVFMVLKLFFWRSWKLLLSPKRSDADLSRPSDVQSCKVQGQSCVSCLKSSCFRVSIGKEIWDFDISFWYGYVTIHYIIYISFPNIAKFLVDSVFEILILWGGRCTAAAPSRDSSGQNE